MPHRPILLLTLLGLGTVGAATVVLVLSPSGAGPPHVVWWLFLVILPVLLMTMILIGRPWAAMVCVAYGTIGLALDLATVISVVGGREHNLTLTLSLMSGIANFALIVFGGRAFWAALGGPRPPESRPPSPPSPSSS